MLNYILKKMIKIKENCKIIINGKLIPFWYFHKFNKKGKYTIKYIFKKNMANTNYILYKCSSLANINLSNFNINNVSNMSDMFYKCKKLTKKNVIIKDNSI